MSGYIVNMGGRNGSAVIDMVDVFHVTSNGVEKVTGHDLILRQGRSLLAAASCGDYILAMGGYNGSAAIDTVDVFHVTSNGVEKVTDHGLSLIEGRYSLAAVSCGNYILAMGGNTGSAAIDTVDVFHVTSNGVEKVTDHGLSLIEGRADFAAASAGNYILAMGGYNGSADVNTVDVFHVTSNGVEKVTGHGLRLSEARYNFAAASAGNYILAMGGYGSNYVNTVDVFHVTANGVEAVTGRELSLSEARHTLAAASAGNYILAMGGYDGANYVDTVDVFHVTANGVEKVTDHGLSLSEARSNLAAVSCGNYILAMGGGGSNSTYKDTVDVFQIFE